MIKNLVIATRQSCNLKLKSPVNIANVSAALIAAGLLFAAPAFAQAPPAEKQKTQEGGSFTADPAYKQPAQEGGSGTQLACDPSHNASPATDPDCKARK